MDVGFSSLGSFSTLFRRRFGEAPSRFRRRLHPSITLPERRTLVLGPHCVSLMTAAFTQIAQFSRSVGPAVSLTSPLHQPGGDE